MASGLSLMLPWYAVRLIVHDGSASFQIVAASSRSRFWSRDSLLRRPPAFYPETLNGAVRGGPFRFSETKEQDEELGIILGWTECHLDYIHFDHLEGNHGHS